MPERVAVLASLVLMFVTASYLSSDGGVHNRLGACRGDEVWLESHWSDSRSRVLVVSGTRVRPGREGLEWFSADAAPADGVRVLLGERDDLWWWAVIVSDEVAKAEPDAWLELRGLLPMLIDSSSAETAMVFHALGVAEWHWAHRFCPRCGGNFVERESGHVLHCADCGRDHFPRTDPAVIMLVTDAADRALLGRQTAWPTGRWSTLAGFVEPGETLEDAVRREVLEETGVVVGDVSYFGSQPWPLPASLMVGFTGRAATTAIEVDNRELEAARWWSREEVRSAVGDRTFVMPPGVSISSSLITAWYGEEMG